MSYKKAKDWSWG